MKYAIPYKYRNDTFNDDAAEFNIKFYQSRNKIEDLIEFVQEYKDKEINILFPEGVHLPTLKSITAIGDKIAARLKASDITSVGELKEHNIKFFFDNELMVTNYTELDAFIKLGVSEIYPANDLMYNINDLSEYCKDKGVKLRLVLNRIPNTSFDKGVNPKSLILRPQDIDILNEYIDVFEFDCGEPYDWAKFDVLQRAWFVRKDWHGELYEINEDVQISFDNDAVWPTMNLDKLSCGRKCNQRLNTYCRKCEQWLDVADTLGKKKIKFGQFLGQI